MFRIVFGVLALASGGLFMATGANSAQVPFPKPPTSIPKEDVDPRMPLFLTCAKSCDDCARLCDMCSVHCAKMLADGRKEHLATLRLCQDCSTICVATARVVGKDGPMSDLLYTACAEACKRCGDACAKHGGDDMIKKCADECRRCEKVCRDLGKPALGKE